VPPYQGRRQKIFQGGGQRKKDRKIAKKTEKDRKKALLPTPMPLTSYIFVVLRIRRVHFFVKNYI